MYNYFFNTQTLFLLSLKKVIVMKITLLKNHLDHAAGETINVTEQRGKYLVRTGVGTEKATKQLKEPVSKKLPKTRKDGVSSVSTPEAHDAYLKSLNSK